LTWGHVVCPVFGVVHLNLTVLLLFSDRLALGCFHLLSVSQIVMPAANEVDVMVKQKVKLLKNHSNMRTLGMVWWRQYVLTT
jgi:hypothetical protein